MLSLRLDILPTYRSSIVREFGPLEVTTALSTARFVAHLTHPHISPSVGLLFLHGLQHAGDAAFAFWSVLGAELFPIPSISDVNPLVGGHRVRGDSKGRRNAVL